jgi:hypothetical protein
MRNKGQAFIQNHIGDDTSIYTNYGPISPSYSAPLKHDRITIYNKNLNTLIQPFTSSLQPFRSTFNSKYVYVANCCTAFVSFVDPEPLNVYRFSKDFSSTTLYTLTCSLSKPFINWICELNNNILVNFGSNYIFGAGETHSYELKYYTEDFVFLQNLFPNEVIQGQRNTRQTFLEDRVDKKIYWLSSTSSVVHSGQGASLIDYKSDVICYSAVGTNSFTQSWSYFAGSVSEDDSQLYLIPSYTNSVFLYNDRDVIYRPWIEYKSIDKNTGIETGFFTYAFNNSIEIAPTRGIGKFNYDKVLTCSLGNRAVGYSISNWNSNSGTYSLLWIAGITTSGGQATIQLGQDKFSNIYYWTGTITAIQGNIIKVNSSGQIMWNRIVPSLDRSLGRGLVADFYTYKP